MDSRAVVLDKVHGMLAAHALGDAHGAPHEFWCNRDSVYTGKLELHPFRINRFTKEKVTFPVASITDDTEMSIALLMTIQSGEYSRKRALRAYLEWANSGCPHLGKNTRALFYGVKTERGYNNRYQKMIEGEVSQSNGSLMRAAPLALVEEVVGGGDWRTAVIQDCDLSNPNPVNRCCSLLYVGWLRALLAGKEPALLPEEERICEEVRTALEQEERDVSGRNKGWVLHALWCCKKAFTATSFADLARDIIERGGDTDTNAAIACALYGARVGFQAFVEEQKENWELLMNSEHNEIQRAKRREAYLFPPNLSEYLECIVP